MQIFKTTGDIQAKLNISKATVNNWLKTGEIERPENGNFYTHSEFAGIIDAIENQSNKLKGRANRSKMSEKYVCFLGVDTAERRSLLLKTLSLHDQNSLSAEQSIFALSIAFLSQARLITANSLLTPLTPLDQFLLAWSKEVQFNPEHNPYLHLAYENRDDDFIGAFYQSVMSISAKSKIGSYYTPSYLLTDINVRTTDLLLDPCCGSGGILLRVLSKNHDPRKVHARDIDKIALNICRVNLCLFFNDKNMTSHVSEANILFDELSDTTSLFSETGSAPKFDFIITNPPWGSKLTQIEKDALIRRYFQFSSTESFVIALYNSMNNLSADGQLVFFLPHSFLNVATHKNIRKHLISKGHSVEIKLLGNAFSGVMSESIRLKYFNQEPSDHFSIINKRNDRSKILFKDILQPDYIISATSDNADQIILDKIYASKHTLLKNNCTFALGVVTGNNDKHIRREPAEGLEPIYKGKDIEPFRFLDPQCFIHFTPDSYQQVAPITYYRQPKIVYKFISDKIVCVFDGDNRLTLNSANIFIPNLDYPMKTIVCLFNSKLYTFIYKKKYHSKKVLRSHIESFPLPEFSDNIHQDFTTIHDKIGNMDIDIQILNAFVYKLFGLNESEIKLIEDTYNGKINSQA